MAIVGATHRFCTSLTAPLYGLVRYEVAILSNQGGISLKSDPKSVKSDQKRLADFKSKVTSVFNQLNLPISIYAATARDQYRKPRTGMWSEMVEDYDIEGDQGPDLEGSIFVGDAGGRSNVERGGDDHSCSDRYVPPHLSCDRSILRLM